MDSHRKRPLILWLAALAILWGLLRPALNAFMASGAGKALAEGRLEAGTRLPAPEQGGHAASAAPAADSAAHPGQALAAAFAQLLAKAFLACAAQPAARWSGMDLPPATMVYSAHPGRAPPRSA